MIRGFVLLLCLTYLLYLWVGLCMVASLAYRGYELYMQSSDEEFRKAVLEMRDLCSNVGMITFWVLRWPLLCRWTYKAVRVSRDAAKVGV